MCARGLLTQSVQHVVVACSDFVIHNASDGICRQDSATRTWLKELKIDVLMTGKRLCIMKVYIESNNLQLESIRYSKKFTLFMFTFAKRRIRPPNVAGSFEHKRLRGARHCSVVECRTGNPASSGSIPSLLPFRRLGIFVLSIDALVDSAV